MISCRDFIPAYSELFKYLEELGGEKAVQDFWNYLSDKYLGNLRELVAEHGIRGCWIYWSKSLNEEAADFTMEMDEEAGDFKIIMHYCPSKGRLLQMKHMEPYHNYCGHCGVLYRRVLEDYGFECSTDFSHIDEARCTDHFVLKKKK